MTPEHLEIVSHLTRIDAKVEAQLAVTKEHLNDVRRDIKDIKEHVQFVRAAGKIIGMGSGVTACVKLVSLFLY